MNDLLILTSPPGSGKTFWIKSFAQVSDCLVISPLRALRDECEEKWGKSIRVMTPEEWMLKKELSQVVIFDEFHLNFYWGDSFRPILWEVFYELAHQAQLTIFLTATISEAMVSELQHFKSHFDEITWIDFGNQRLKNDPRVYRRSPSKRWLEDLIKEGPRWGGTNLIFCQYREEVFKWQLDLSQRGFKVWSCVGGEAKFMKDKMRTGEIPDFIVATSVLSHGVNLPPITCVYLLYPLENLDFWIQMVARGGRMGQRYCVYALENPSGIKWSPVINVLAILGLSLKMSLKSYFSQVDQWFLKASS